MPGSISRALISGAAIWATLGWSGGGDRARAREVPKKPLSARALATRDPCRLLAAIVHGGETRAAGEPESSPWKVHLVADCCDVNVMEHRPVVMTLLEPRGRVSTLIGWGRSCGDGLGGPKVQPGARIDFYGLGLRVVDDGTLAFDVVEQSFIFDRKGKKTLDVMAGCSSFTGEAGVEVPANALYRPADPYLLRGYVPPGFDEYGTWTALRRTTLYDGPGSNKVVAAVDRCETVDARHGEIRGRPWAAHVLYPRGPFHEGDLLWILARNLEEGYFQLWYRGAVRDDLAKEVDLALAKKDCRIPSEKCWLRFEAPPVQEFWVEVETKSGTAGWTKRPADFTASAGCPGTSGDH